MADQQQQQQSQVTPEMLKKLQGEKEEVKTRPTFSGNKHWIIKFLKDIAYISTFPYLWVKQFFQWLLKYNKNCTIKTEVNIKKTDKSATKNNEATVSLEETEQSTLEATVSLEETTSSNNNNGNQNVVTSANLCSHPEQATRETNSPSTLIT